jgi:transcriptional regulator NrdR family protein
VGELVMEGLSTVDPVAYGRIALVYRNFRGAKVFCELLGRIAAGENKGRLWVQRPPVTYVGFAGGLL